MKKWKIVTRDGKEFSILAKTVSNNSDYTTHEMMLIFNDEKSQTQFAIRHADVLCFYIVQEWMIFSDEKETK